MPSFRMELLIFVKNATGSTPPPPKFWLTLERELRKRGAKEGREAVPVRVGFGLLRGAPLEKSGAVQVEGLGLKNAGLETCEPRQRLISVAL
jgi:hypothetical protein